MNPLGLDHPGFVRLMPQYRYAHQGLCTCGETAHARHCGVGDFALLDHLYFTITFLSLARGPSGLWRRPPQPAHMGRQRAMLLLI